MKQELGFHGPIGSTMGIVGALVLGDAAVSANLVSPISIIIVAITALASFAIPNFSLQFHFRILRFAFIILGTFFGFIGISVGLFGYIGILSSCSSFGVPYLSPYVPITLFNNEGYFLSPIWKREKRQDSLNTKRKFKESHISKLWQNSKHN